MGSWSFGYDQLNRLVTAANTGGAMPTGNWAPYFCWAYDSFGNRLNQSTSDVAFPAGQSSNCTTTGTLYQNAWTTYTAQNQIATTNVPGAVISPYYDPAGDIGWDDAHSYIYDAEGRICAQGSWIMVGYMYDAAGNRVAKGSITSWSCDVTTNGFQVTEGPNTRIALDQLGHQSLLPVLQPLM